MRVIVGAVAIVATGIAIWMSQAYAQLATDFLFDIFLANPPNKSVGVMASIITGFAIFFYIAISQNLTKKNLVTRYRWAELKLVKIGKMSIEEITTYHSRYNWFSYAGMSFSTLLIITSLLYGQLMTTQDKEQSIIVFLSLALLGIASILLAVVDLFHTNTLSPLITAEKRFEIIDSVIRIGGAAIVLQICAISIFLSLINAWLSIFLSATSFFLVAHFTILRGVPLSDLSKERSLNEIETKEVGNA